MEEEKKKRQKYGGRVKGTPNKVTTEGRAILAEVVNENACNVKEKLDALRDPKEWLTLYLKLCEFVIPKQQAVSLSSTSKLSDLKSELLDMERSED